jgi:SAM-dependent methyltransferase
MADFPGFGPASRDYARFRKGFPDSFFRRLAALGISGRLLDIGTGTGTLARGTGGVGLDRSVALLREAPDLVRVAGQAERLPFGDRTFDAVTAGQCWIWLDGPRAAREALRVLRPGGWLLVAHLDYMPVDGNVAEETERLILRYNPGWTLAGLGPRERRDREARVHLAAAGFGELSFESYLEPIEYSHEGWRGRIRACNGVIALRDPDAIAALDRDLAEMLRSHPDPATVPHRISLLSGRRPLEG